MVKPGTMKKGMHPPKYMLLATRNPWFFYVFLLTGVVMFLWLTLTTQVETADGTQTLFYLIFARAGKGL